MYSNSLSEDILYFISGFGIVQGFLLAALLYFHPKSDRSVNAFLALYILTISTVMTMPISMNLIGWQNSYLLQPIPLLPGIWLYFYLLSFKETITWRKALPHFLPVLVFLFLTYWNLSAISAAYPDAKRIPAEGLKRITTIVNIVLRAMQQFLYFFLARKALRSYQGSIKQLFSETSRIDLHWAKFLINGYIVLISGFLVIFPLMLRFPQYFNALLLICMAIGTPYIYMATYKGVVQPTIWQTQPGIKKEMIEEEIQEVEGLEEQTNGPEKNKALKAGLGEQRVVEIVQKIMALMEGEKVYQETDLTLQQLAAKLQLPTYQVSQAINEGMKKNFYDLVNGHRVEEAKRLLQDPKNFNYTILSVGFEAGFNSKTTFNTVFKKFTGLTPTDYRNRGKAHVLSV